MDFVSRCDVALCVEKLYGDHSTFDHMYSVRINQRYLCNMATKDGDSPFQPFQIIELCQLSYDSGSLGRLVLEPLLPKVASVGKSVTFLCALAEGRTGTFTWTKDGILLLEDDRIQRANSRRTSTLNIENVEASDRGLYTCTVSDADSEDRQSASLAVEGMSLFITYPPLESSDKLPGRCSSANV